MPQRCSWSGTRTEHFAGGNRTIHKLYLALMLVWYQQTDVQAVDTNSLCERFHRMLKDQFFEDSFCKGLCETVEQLQDNVNRYQ